MFRVRLLGSISVLVTLGISQATGATILPTQVVYSNWTEETEEARICEIILDVSNPPSREVVKFIMLAGYNKFDSEVLAGFLMAAADIMTIDKFEIVQISDAAFNSGAFSSLGQLGYEIYDDGTVMATTDDPQIATPFISAVLAGDYELSFSRPEPGAGARTYKIIPAPPDAVTSNFIDCMGRVEAQSKLARLSASAKRSPLPE
ncbi:MAG: hypothetical protein EOQ86_05945 [Mesorhizobium sp.]|uniref:hypothetical protein n=1 Tax=Mesorhizobium sp. TaxID=1871066 RepID=UPI000FCAA745|nr:hypothetical protein [Mesorhizobium sp.]RUV47197.1 hypothetical protein EOA85_34775 [Mesorhizobium sp. M5C.F.Ca.IN.020.29.1.1]RWB97361.1 MAG: hypothetical protein EOQ56_23630 [Mesorhizobium sp.]RWH81318.1 MAG: hypothetical protein EOQ85_09845 [Mesorhizobium sp.]RWH85709.1 MAG: hypothetical protein EOQ86_05945 [Mesorhizobium sp.]RWH90966.1 MAG: hypothetical protein EOQ87_09600 [Mesorhizobium sp.]